MITDVEKFFNISTFNHKKRDIYRRQSREMKMNKIIILLGIEHSIFGNIKILITQSSESLNVKFFSALAYNDCIRMEKKNVR